MQDVWRVLWNRDCHDLLDQWLDDDCPNVSSRDRQRRKCYWESLLYSWSVLGNTWTIHSFLFSNSSIVVPKDWFVWGSSRWSLASRLRQVSIRTVPFPARLAKSEMIKGVLKIWRLLKLVLRNSISSQKDDVNCLFDTYLDILVSALTVFDFSFATYVSLSLTISLFCIVCRTSLMWYRITEVSQRNFRMWTYCSTRQCIARHETAFPSHSSATLSSYGSRLCIRARRQISDCNFLILSNRIAHSLWTNDSRRRHERVDDIRSELTSRSSINCIKLWKNLDSRSSVLLINSSFFSPINVLLFSFSLS